MSCRYAKILVQAGFRWNLPSFSPQVPALAVCFTWLTIWAVPWSHWSVWWRTNGAPNSTRPCTSDPAFNLQPHLPPSPPSLPTFLPIACFSSQNNWIGNSLQREYIYNIYFCERLKFQQGLIKKVHVDFSSFLKCPKVVLLWREAVLGFCFCFLTSMQLYKTTMGLWAGVEIRRSMVIYLPSLCNWGNYIFVSKWMIEIIRVLCKRKHVFVKHTLSK